MKEAAGTLLYRQRGPTLEVLLVHPSGNYNRHAPWSLPKGLLDAGEDHEAAARRETWEETGVVPAALVPLGTIDYTKSRKRVYGFAGEAPPDAAPHCAAWEVDRAEFVEIDKAYELLHPEQRPFLDRLRELLESREGTADER
jgi:predicted NUDIX family NTP pyrophosphohydrolase